MRRVVLSGKQCQLRYTKQPDRMDWSHGPFIECRFRYMAIGTVSPRTREERNRPNKLRSRDRAGIFAALYLCFRYHLHGQEAHGEGENQEQGQ
jgi:hypothetical protein